MISERILSELIGLIYQAAVDPKEWTVFLNRGSQIFQAHCATIHFQDTASSTCGFNVALNMDRRDVERYVEHFAALNPYMKRIDVQEEGRAYVRNELLDTASLVQSEFYNDWAEPQNLFDFVAGTMFRRGPVAGNVTFWRSESAEACGKKETYALQLLLPHLVRAIQIHRRIGGVERRCEALGRSLDMVRHALLLLDMAGKVVMMNEAAQTILRRNDGLRVRHDVVEAERPVETNSLRHAVRCAGVCAQGQGLSDTGLVLISRRSPGRPLLAWVAPLVRGAVADERGPLVAVFVVDPDGESETPERVLRRVFGLTAAEARLAATLLKGNDLESAAASFGVSRNTVRSQLQTIFGKTGTSRQAELIRVLTQLSTISAG